MWLLNIIESIRYSVSLKKPSTRWWQLKDFSFSPLPGEDVPIWLYNIFQMGWFNHQLVHQIRNDLGVEFVSFTASLDWKVISEETVAYTLRGSD